MYRFLGNRKVTEEILKNKLTEKCSKAVSSQNVIAVVDTSVVTLNSHIGRITDFTGLGRIGKNQYGTSYGYMLHPIYVIDQKDGTPYGIAGVELLNRSMEESPLSRDEKHVLKNKLPIEQKESYRWVGPCIEARDDVLKGASNITFVMDREGDIWEVFERVPGPNTDVVIRSKQNRRILNSKGVQTSLYTELEHQKVKGQYEITLPRKKGRKRKTAIVEVKIGRCKILPNQFNNSDKPIELSYVELKERSTKDIEIEDPIHWVLWTNKVDLDLSEAKEVISIYAKRWNIEVFFKLLKSDGYDIEQTQLETGNAIRKLTIILMDAATKVLQLKAARNGETDLEVKAIFNQQEIECLELLNEKLSGNTALQRNPYPKTHLAWASWVIARLAGWKEFYNKKNPPGNKTFIEGLEKFEILLIGYSLTK